MNKVNLSQFNIPPENIDLPEGQGVIVCIYGEYTIDQINTGYCKVNITDVKYKDNYTYLYIDQINSTPIYEYMDGFSPNLNKQLHIGHFSNLVYASAFSNMNISKKNIAIYGDTLTGTDLENKNYSNFKYNIDTEYFASEQVLQDQTLLEDGTDDYNGTKVFTLKDNSKLVGVKSDNTTTYFYQDVALLEKLNAKTLYLTGKEQSTHFNQLKEIKGLCYNITHLGLGLISLKGEKMSSRKGNVIYMSDLLNEVNKEFNNIELAYNTLAGYILMSNPVRDLKINIDNIKDPKQSIGLYISYTYARIFNLPVNYNDNNCEVDNEIKFILYKSKMTLNPSLLCNYLLKYCKQVNNDYTNKPAIDNQLLYKQHLTNIIYMLESLGLYTINKI